ncbi:MAG: hypothetical protein HY646_13115 [Acidobacteria bacterium]|nr:hypothetical protein [Acidobacteriota bacterium]
MIHETDETGWKQHFPTYRFKERDVALEEYRFATKTVEAEERVFLNAVNISVVVGATLGSIAIGTLDRVAAAFSPVVPQPAVFAIVLILTGGFAVIVLRYFADRQRAFVFAARKVIVLRRMLGMSYGELQLVLPNWRIEAADEPFAVRLFPGWNTHVAYPCYAIAGISSAVSFFVLAYLLRQAQAIGLILPFNPLTFLSVASVAWFLLLCWLYRVALFDMHERALLLLAQRLAMVIRLKLVSNVEYVIYRATLATYELSRLGIDLSMATKLLIHIEDKQFYSHLVSALRVWRD